MREMLSIALVMLLLPNFNAASAASQVDSTAAKKEALAVPLGSVIEVRLKGNEKIRGRMGEVSEEGFVVQTAQNGKLENQKITFTDLKSIKLVGKSHTTRNVLIVSGIGAVVFVAVAL